MPSFLPKLDATHDCGLRTACNADTDRDRKRDGPLPQEILRHPKYNRNKNNWDAALLVLSQPVTWVKPVALAGPETVRAALCLRFAGCLFSVCAVCAKRAVPYDEAHLNALGPGAAFKPADAPLPALCHACRNSPQQSR